MAKKNKDTEAEQRQTRKEILIANKDVEAQRKIRLIVGSVVGLLVVLFAIAFINEFVISPTRPVAEVDDAAISLGDWQERVRLERAQYINLLENQLEAFDGDVGTVQQFAGQAINTLYDEETLGQTVLNTMIEDAVIAEEAAKRGIVVTDEEIDAEIGATFNYFGGGLPTPFPTPTNTVEPTPSITPIPTQVITDVVPTNVPPPTPALGPTSTPLPAPTAVSEAAFQEEWNDILNDYKALGVSETQYREFIRIQLLRQKVADAIADELEMPTEAEQANFYFIIFDTEEAANEAEALIAEGDFLPVWNEFRSLPIDPEAESLSFASEQFWQSETDVITNIGSEVADLIFGLDIGEPSGVIERILDEETSQYILVMVSGRELRPLADTIIQQAKIAGLTNYIDQKLVGILNLTGFDQGRTPTQPRLDEKFLAQPTATPIIPTVAADGEDGSDN